MHLKTILHKYTPPNIEVVDVIKITLILSAIFIIATSIGFISAAFISQNIMLALPSIVSGVLIIAGLTYTGTCYIIEHIRNMNK